MSLINDRLKQLNIDTLVIDKHERIGDNWRKRYHSLTLHNQTQVNHLPLMPFPKTWPTYIAKDKLAGWFEYYVESLELNVLVTCTALDEGFDMPQADGALILSASSSKRQRVQRMGRVLRITENKPNALIITVYSSKTEFDKLMEEAKHYHQEGVKVVWERQDEKT